MIKKIIYGFLIAFATVMVLLLVFISLIIRNVVEKNSKEWIGRSVSIDKLDLNYFTGTAKVAGFKLYEPDDATNFVSFDTLIIDTEPYQLFRNELVMERLYLKGLEVNVVMYDSAHNFDDMLKFYESNADNTDSLESNKEPLHFQLSNLELNGALVNIHDAVIDKDLEMHDLDFFIPYIGWNQDKDSEAGLKFNFKNGGYFQSKINVDPQKGDFDAEIILKELDISGYDDFISKYMDLGSFEGRTDLNISLEGNTNSPEKLIASGRFNIHDFKLQDYNEKPLIGIKRMEGNLKKADVANMQFVLDTLKFTEPYVYFEMHDSTNNFNEMMDRAFPHKADSNTTVVHETAPDSTSQKLYYALNNLIIEHGIVDFMDATTEEPFEYHLSEIEMATDSITSQSSWVEMHSNMLLNERGKLIAKLGVNPSNPMELDLDYTITDFMLSDLNIYSRHYMGFPILYGDMYYKGHTIVKQGQLASENKLVIHNVELGNKGGGLYNLPIKFALFLLKDKDGVVTLDVPVRGDLKDPKVSVGKIVWNTFKNLIVKAVAAPAKLLSGLLGTDPDQIKAIEYDFKDTVLTENKKNQLDLLLQLEQKKPGLEIELVYFNDASLEKSEIALQEAGKVFNEKHQKDYLQDKAGFEEFVRAQIQSDTLSSVMDACRVMIDDLVLDSIANEFHRIRLDGISGYLIDANDSTEIAVVNSKPEAPKNLGSKPIFEIKYGMKEELMP